MTRKACGTETECSSSMSIKKREACETETECSSLISTKKREAREIESMCSYSKSTKNIFQFENKENRESEDTKFSGRMKRKACEMESGRSWVRGPLIGKGACASVYYAYAPTNNRHHLPLIMAVKSAEISASSSLQEEKRVLTDFRGRSHNHIVKCYGDDVTLNEDNKTIYNFLLEFADGGNLAELIGKSGDCGLAEKEVKHYTRCVLEGLSAVHDAGYVHCDLKPENLLLMTDYLAPTGFVAKIADFGTAKKRAEEACLRGTPMYLSPEAVNFHIQEAASDIWAVGCIVLKMLTGRPPWNLKNEANETTDRVHKLLQMIASAQSLPMIPDSVSQEGKDFLKCCFARSPFGRLTADELLDHKFVKESNEGSNRKDNKSEEVSCSSNIIPNIPPAFACNSVIPSGA